LFASSETAISRGNLTPESHPRLSIVFASAEVAPLASTGGLGEVSRALPRALAGLGHRVRVFAPFYQAVRRRGIETEPVASVGIPGYGGGFRVLRALRAMAPAELYLIEHGGFFDRPGIYGERGGEYGDNLERFAFFSRAVIEAIGALDLAADVVHANDWHTGVVPAHLRLTFAGHPQLRHAKTVFTIHNLAYQGRFSGDRLAATGLPASAFHMDGLEYHGMVNLMKAGIVYSDVITTVSPRYAEEIRTPEFGEGLDGILRARSAALHGILNGIDTDAWNPMTDPHLLARYGVASLAGKRVCKQALVRELGLRIAAETPLVGMVTRMTPQKGVDIVLGMSAELLGLGVGLAVLGAGDPALEQGFRYLADSYPGRVAVRIGYDEPLSHRIEAGADVFLMPSRYEPCGLNQMYSLRYGTVPVVHATGGLHDTVRDPSEDPRHPNGFKFHHPRGDEMVEALRRAIEAYRIPRLWETVQCTGMAEDFSWSRSAQHYAELYRRLFPGRADGRR
jgi:starch synthase